MELHNEVIRMIASFYNAQAPTHGRENELALLNWIQARRQDKSKEINPELCAQVEREFPWWTWDPRELK
jgi:hypothetical protein